MACVAGCSIENDTLPDGNWRDVNTFNQLRHPDLAVFHFSLACNHCEDAPCQSNCPTIAFTRDLATGAIIHHAEACIGCQYCTWACPFDAPKYNRSAGIVQKCTFCLKQIQQDIKPACVTACPLGALEYDILESEAISYLVPGFIEQNIRPAIQLVPLVENRTKPKVLGLDTPDFSNEQVLEWIDQPMTKVKLSHEWPLAIFTWLLGGLVGWFAAHLIIGIDLNPYFFFGAGAVSLILSSFHLGKKTRAWRSILHVRRSWLSREIAAFILFLLFALVYVIFLPLQTIGITALVLGCMTLISADMVYRFLVHPDKSLYHSAWVTTTGLLWFGVLSGIPFIIGFTLTLKLGIYLLRKVKNNKLNVRTWWISSIIRVGILLFALVAVGGMHVFQISYPLIIALIGLGELIDRLEFYQEAEVPNPKLSLHDHLNTLIHEQ